MTEDNGRTFQALPPDDAWWVRFAMSIAPSRRPLRLSFPPRTLAIFLFFGIFVPASLSIHFLGSIGPLWVTNAVVVATLLSSVRPTWPSFVVVQILADFMAGILFGDGFGVSIGAAGCDSIEIIIVASALRWISADARLFSSLGQISRFGIVCILVPVFSASLGAAVLSFNLQIAYSGAWVNWYLSAVFGLLIVTPFLLMWADTIEAPSLLRRGNWEVILLALLVGGVGAIDFSIPNLPGMFLCFPFLLLAAFRGGLLGATTAAVVLTIVASWLTLAGWGPIANAHVMTSTTARLLLLQLYLATVLLSSLPVAVMLEHRKLLSTLETLNELSRMARHDMLTGLPNRTMFQEKLASIQALVRRNGGYTALLLFDLDRFKPVNDLHGHAAGDRLLQMVAERVSAIARETDTVARLGGDEFAIVAHVDEPAVAQYLALRIIAALSKPFSFRDLTVQIGCSVGVALSPGDGTQGDLLVRRADAALYRAKSEGRNCFRFFEVGMDDAVRERAELEVALREAVAQDRLVPYYQPIVAVGTARMVGFEMLARWTHPTRGNISPTVFVPVAESIGLIGTIAERLIRRACRAALAWPDHLIVTVNISPVQLRDRALPALVSTILTETGLPARRLEIELTESALIDDFELARAILVELKTTGVKLTLDDFGTGYSSLRHLQGLPLDKIKIDMGFVRSMMSVTASRKIVAGVIGLGHSLGLPIVAEGVEDEAAAEELRLMGCDLGQGWLYGPAMRAEEVEVLLARLPAVAIEALGLVEEHAERALGAISPLLNKH